MIALSAMSGVMVATVVIAVVLTAVSLWILNLAYGRKWGNEEENRGE